MKVVLFCGGKGMRIREYTDEVPKPMIKIGSRPVLWHIMKYYAHYGHNDFLICLGYKGEVIKRYFLEYQEWISNDFIIKEGGGRVELFDSDLDDWNITFVDTGLEANIGERLWAVRGHLMEEEMFMCNYADGVTDLHLPDMILDFQEREKVGSFLAIPPNYSFHVVNFGRDGEVHDLVAAQDSSLRVNGGYFLFTPDLFDYMKPGDELVEEPFYRLIAENKLIAYNHEGFWGCMDTFKEKMMLEEMYKKGDAPWELWKGDAKVKPRHRVIDKKLRSNSGSQ